MRYFAFLTVLLAVLLIFGCSTGMSDKHNSSESDVVEQVETLQETVAGEEKDLFDDTLSLAETYIDLMLNGEYQKAFDMSGEDLIETYGSAENMEIMWGVIQNQIGAYVQSESPDVEQDNDKTTYTFPSDFEAGKFNIIVTVQDGKVIAFGVLAGNGPAQNRNAEAKQNGPTPSNDLPDGVSEADIIVNKGKVYELYGKLTYPSNVTGPIPAVVLVHGSGAHDMDETISTNEPFKDIAYALSEQGIAVLRYNKATYAYPEDAGELSMSVDLEVVRDAVAAENALTQQSEITFSQIYVAGHSLGGMMAPRIAAQGGYDGMILLAGSTRSLIDILYDQGQYLLPLYGFTVEQLDAQLAEYERMRADGIEIMKLPVSEMEGKTIFGFPAAYIYSIENPPAQQYIRELNIPMLILQGSKDFQVYSDKDFKLYEDITKGLRDVTTREYEGLNHLFMPSFMEQPDVTEYIRPAKVDDRVLNDIAEWILTRE